jgi:hypothetical protein
MARFVLLPQQARPGAIGHPDRQEASEMEKMEIEGVRIWEPTSTRWETEYTRSDIEALHDRGDWHSWQEQIEWLEQYGDRDNEFTPGETIAMVEDLRSLRDSGERFTRDPAKAYRMAHRFREDNNHKFAQDHQVAIELAHRRRVRA